jgi:hypothetical protein
MTRYTRKEIGIICGLLTCLVIIYLFPLEYLFSRSSAQITVIDTHRVPRSCYQHRRMNRYRSSVPRQWLGGYCGGIYTDMGPFNLVETSWLKTFGMPREEIIDLVKPGCQYTIYFYGFGPSPHSRAGYSNVVRHTIYAANPAGDCADP